MTRLVTFLFTDIEGSSPLWERHGSAMAQALDAHDRLSRSCVERHSGRVVKMIGDGVFAVFADPLNALHASLDLQRALQLADCNGVTVRVRCGVHVGPSEERNDDYVGNEVNRAARIMEAAHGGQVLLSSSAWELLRGRLPPDVSLHDAGDIAVRGSVRPERVFQLCHPELPSRFPALRSALCPSNVVDRGPALVGRDDDLVAVSGLVAVDPIVTIVGAGGIGKTGLAQATAHENLGAFPEGVWWVDLAPRTDRTQVIRSLASVLGISELRADDALDEVISRIRRWHALIVLDNCEHLLDAVADIVEAARGVATGVHWLATSQQPIKVGGERVYRLDPLTIPEPGTASQNASQFSAVALLAQRVSALDRRFAITEANVDAVIDICRDLDGLPLAIEMAAARIPTIGVESVRVLLRERLRLLASGRRRQSSRHQTLHAALDWSHSLLAPDEQIVFRRLGVFSGGFTLELAQRVATDGSEYETQHDLDDWRVLDALTSLVEKSLVQLRVDARSSPRHVLLETTRLYALERLSDAGERDAAMNRHARVMAEFIERAYEEHWVSADAPWITHVEVELDNLSSALRHAVARGDAEAAAAIVGSVWPVLRLLDRQFESRAWMQASESLIRNASDRRAERALAAMPYVYGQWIGQRTVDAGREAVQRLRARDQPRDLYLALSGLAWALGMCWPPGPDGAQEIAGVLRDLARLEDAVPPRCRCWGAVARTIHLADDQVSRVKVLTAMHDLALSIGAFERAATADVNVLGPLLNLGRFDEVIARSRRLADSGSVRGERLGSVLFNCAEALVLKGDVEASRGVARDGLRVLTQCNATLAAFNALFVLATLESRYADAARLHGRAESLRAGVGLGSPGAPRPWTQQYLEQIDHAIGREERERLAREGASMTEAQALAAARLV